MKIGEWDGIGRARALIVRQLAELGADELAAHVTVQEETGRQRLLVATDLGLLDFTWSPDTPQPDSPWSLRGSLARWTSVKGLRLQTDGQWDPVSEELKSVWRLVAEDPKISLNATASNGADRSLPALLDFARACLDRSR